MMYYSVMTQAYSEKEIPSSPNRSRTYDLPITSSDALPLSYRRLVGAKAIKLGSWDKHPAYCLDLNVKEWHMRNENVMDDASIHDAHKSTNQLEFLCCNYERYDLDKEKNQQQQKTGKNLFIELYNYYFES